MPIWGWAQFFTQAALIAQSAFHDLIDQSALLLDLKSSLPRHQWRFLLINITIAIRIIGWLILYLLLLVVILAYSLLILDIRPPQTDPQSPIQSIMGAILWIGIIGVVLWQATKFFIVELITATEEQFHRRQLFQRCQSLIQGSFWTVLGVMVVVLLLTLPPSFLITLFASRVARLLIRLTPLLTAQKYTLHSICTGVIAFGTLVATFPLWQTTKAALYYALRCRQEGLDLQLRDRD